MHLPTALATEKILAEIEELWLWVGGLCLHVAVCVTGHFFVGMHMFNLRSLF